MRAAYVELEPRSSGKRSSDEGPSWTGEVPAATRDQHLKTELALGTSFHHYCPQGIARTAWKGGWDEFDLRQAPEHGGAGGTAIPTRLRGVSAHRVAVVQAVQPGEDWRWRYFDEALI